MACVAPGRSSRQERAEGRSGTTVEARDAAGGRPGATLRAALSGRQGASWRLPDVPASRRAPLLPCRPDSAAQTMTVVRNPGWAGQTRIAAPAPTIIAPDSRASQAGRTGHFSSATSTVRNTIQTGFMTPATNSSSISAQQQPAQ